MSPDPLQAEKLVAEAFYPTTVPMADFRFRRGEFSNRQAQAASAARPGRADWRLLALAIMLSATLPFRLAADTITIQGALSGGNSSSFLSKSMAKDDLFGEALTGATDGSLSSPWRNRFAMGLPLYIFYSGKFHAGLNLLWQQTSLQRTALYQTSIHGNNALLQGRESLYKHRTRKIDVEGGYNFDLGKIKATGLAGARLHSSSAELRGKMKGSGEFQGQREFIFGHIQNGSRISYSSLSGLAGLNATYDLEKYRLEAQARFFSSLSGRYEDRVYGAYYNSGAGVAVQQAISRKTSADFQETGGSLALYVGYKLANNILFYTGLFHESTTVILQDYLSLNLIRTEAIIQERTATSTTKFLDISLNEILLDRMIYSAPAQSQDTALRFGVEANIDLK